MNILGRKFGFVVGMALIVLGSASPASAAVRGSTTSTPPPSTVGNTGKTFVSPP